MTIEQKIIDYRRHIHKNPELGYETYETAKYVNGILDNIGYKTKLILNDAAVIAYLDLGKDKTIGLRADMDALPVLEAVDCSFKSCNSNMHACGHDCHTAMLLGAAHIIYENKDKLSWNVRLIFQCAEEGPLPGGAVKVIETHLLDDVDEFYAFHVSPDLEVGQIGIKPGEAFAGPDFFDIVAKGVGAHGSTPEKGNNPIIPLSEAILRVNNMIENRRKTERCAATITKILAGNAYNVILDTAKAGGTIRSFSIKSREEIGDSIRQICAEIGKKYNVEMEFSHHYGYDPLFNDIEASHRVMNIAKSCQGITDVIELTDATMVGEDFTYYIKNKPGCIGWLGIRTKNEKAYALHSPNFVVDEKALIIGANLLAKIALERK